MNIVPFKRGNILFELLHLQKILDINKCKYVFQHRQVLKKALKNRSLLEEISPRQDGQGKPSTNLSINKLENLGKEELCTGKQASPPREKIICSPACHHVKLYLLTTIVRFRATAIICEI